MVRPSTLSALLSPRSRFLWPLCRQRRTVEHFDQFAGVALDPNSLYWIEVRVEVTPLSDGD